jgi:hypothetical protein
LLDHALGQRRLVTPGIRTGTPPSEWKRPCHRHSRPQHVDLDPIVGLDDRGGKRGERRRVVAGRDVDDELAPAAARGRSSMVTVGSLSAASIRETVEVGTPALAARARRDSPD